MSRTATRTTARRLAAGALIVAGALVAAAPVASAASGSGSYRPAQQSPQPIFFSSDRDGSPQIYRLSPNAGSTRLTNSNTTDTQPSVNRDRTLVAFTSLENVLHAYRKIEIMNADGSGRRMIISGNADFTDPSLSPDGKKIAFTQRVGHDQQILVINTDGSNLRQLTNTPNSKNRQPVWSPDGQNIAFTSERHGFSDIWMMGLSGDASPQRVSYDGMGAAEPAWSPDGKKIAYSLYNQESQDTEVVWVDAYSVNVVHNVSNHPSGDDSQPSWTPDGKNIVFTSESGSQRDLIAANLSGTDTRVVTQAGDQNFDADCGYPSGNPVRPVDNPPANSAR